MQKYSRCSTCHQKHHHYHHHHHPRTLRAKLPLLPHRTTKTPVKKSSLSYSLASIARCPSPLPVAAAAGPPQPSKRSWKACLRRWRHRSGRSPRQPRRCWCCSSCSPARHRQRVPAFIQRCTSSNSHLVNITCICTLNTQLQVRPHQQPRPPSRLQARHVPQLPLQSA